MTPIRKANTKRRDKPLVISLRAIDSGHEPESSFARVGWNATIEGLGPEVRTVENNGISPMR
jgi:hypothetical protein